MLFRTIFTLSGQIVTLQNNFMHFMLNL